MNAPAAGYSLGVDLGTTFTAAAVHRDGRLQMVSLGNRSMVVPSVLFQKDDGELLVGEAAETRAESAPGRVAREFKRRMGDPAPLLLGGTPHSPEALTGRLLRWVVDKVSELEGAPPRSIALTHPANWKTFKIDVLRQAYEMAGLAATPVTFLSEPEAASLAYAADERPPPRSRIAVYDLGGGTFDASVLENRGDRFMILGDPGGIERLGGIDFDDALFHFVRSQVPGIDDVDVEDPDVLADLLDLRRRCVEAKEALSADLDTSVTARLGAARHEIRVLRKEFEDLIRPTLRYTTEALARTIEAAGLTAADLHTVLLVGGSSRVPLVGETVSAQMGRPVAVDIHPKHSVALGAALVAAGASPSELLPGGAPVV
ncbi:MAG: Hsp70 family protein, partial [Acidimicrobiia bacterium]|nr:Hsp70 family protein [Acidimicrobiia bacterium]